MSKMISTVNVLRDFFFSHRKKRDSQIYNMINTNDNNALHTPYARPTEQFSLLSIKYNVGAPASVDNNIGRERNVRRWQMPSRRSPELIIIIRKC